MSTNKIFLKTIVDDVIPELNPAILPLLEERKVFIEEDSLKKSEILSAGHAKIYECVHRHVPVTD